MHVISMKCSSIQKFDIPHIADDHPNLLPALSALMQLSLFHFCPVHLLW